MKKSVKNPEYRQLIFIRQQLKIKAGEKGALCSLELFFSFQPLIRAKPLEEKTPKLMTVVVKMSVNS